MQGFVMQGKINLIQLMELKNISKINQWLHNEARNTSHGPRYNL